MQKTIQFKAKRKDNKEWIFGYYFYDHVDGTHFIDNYYNSPQCSETGFSDLIHEWVEVLPETLGQLSNHLSNNANKNVYVGDLISFDLSEGFGEPASFNHKETVISIEGNYFFYKNVVVTGNIHDK